MSGFILWSGASLIDGAPLVVVAIRNSTNRKTGDMVQTYILRADVNPVEAIKRGLDASICGECVHRGDGSGRGRTCYVNVGQGALSVWRAYRRGRYFNACDLSDVGAGRVVRLGTYGDPAAVPSWVWHALTFNAVAHTGYTHRWRAAADLRGLCMASVDNEAEHLQAVRAGWRTFRVALPTSTPYLPREARCPASVEAGKLMTCDACRACNGAASGRRGSIVIQAHGGAAVMANVRRLAQGVAA